MECAVVQSQREGATKGGSQGVGASALVRVPCTQPWMVPGASATLSLSLLVEPHFGWV